MFSPFFYPLTNEQDDPTDEELMELIVSDDRAVIVERPSKGYICTKCGELYPHSESNQTNGTLICWACRNFG